MKAYRLLQMTTYALIITLLPSCMNNYYKISKVPNASTPKTVIQSNLKRYFILRNGDSAYHMSNIIINNDKQLLTCTLNTLPNEHKLHLKLGRGGNMRYREAKGEGIVLNEVHVYVLQDSAAAPGPNYSLPFDKIMNIEVLGKDNDRTKVSHVFGYIGIAILVFLAFGTFVAIAYTSS